MIPARRLAELEVSRAAQKAVALAQQEKSTWTRADLIKYLGRVLPRSGMDPAAAAALLEEVADRALRVGVRAGGLPGGTGAGRGAGQLAARRRAQRLSAARRRAVRHARAADHGTAHGRTRARQRRAAHGPRRGRAGARRGPGATRRARWMARAQDDARGPRTQTGLRVDQAAAALSVLTDGRRVSVINAPAGSGKTWVLAAAGRAWAAAGLGRVIGITPSQSARNTLAAGVPESYNAAQFLGHLPGQRGARGPVQLQPGDLVLMDEASMVANPDLADVISPGRRQRRQGDPGR